MSQPQPAAGGPDSASPVRKRTPLWLARIGLLLLFIAILVPVGMALFGSFTSREVGVLLAQAAVFGIASWLLLELLLHRGSRMARGVGLVLLGLLVLAESGYTSWARLEMKGALFDLKQAVFDAQALRRGDKQAADRLSAADALPQVPDELLFATTQLFPQAGLTRLAYGLTGETRRQALENHAFESNYLSHEPGQILDNSVLISIDAIVRARGRQRQLETMIAEESGQAESAFKRSEKIQADANLSEADLADLGKFLTAKREAARKLQADFERASRAAIARREEMLALAQGNLGAISLRGNNLRFRTRTLKNAYEKLADALDDAETEEQQSFDALTHQRSESLRKFAEHLANLVPGQP